MRDLDAEWAVKHPPKSQDERTFMWGGVAVVRLPEMPIAAFDEIENAPPEPDPEAPADAPVIVRRRSDMRAIVAAVRTCLDPVCYADFDSVVDGGTVTVERLMDLWEALVSETMQRPTRQPAASSTGPSQNGMSLTAGRSTTEEWTSDASPPAASPTSPTPTS